MLGAILGAVGIVLVAFSAASGLTGSAGHDALAIALVLLIVGMALYASAAHSTGCSAKTPRRGPEVSDVRVGFRRP